jgi:hypothetical protein
MAVPALRGQPSADFRRPPSCLFKKSNAPADVCSGLMRQRGHGQAVVEFCLVAMLFFTLLFAILDFGMVMNDWVSVTTAASVGARQAAVGACFDGSASDLAICATQNETSVIGAVMDSAPLLAADGNCQDPPAPSANFRCVTHVDIALVNLTVQQASCEYVEVWRSARTAQSGSSSSVIAVNTPAGQVPWPANSLVGMLLTFTGGANDGVSRTITANTATAITVGSAFPQTPAVGNTFEVLARNFQPIPAADWLAACATGPLDLRVNDTLNVIVRAVVQLPVPMLGLPTDMQVENSSTVRFEGGFVS